MRMENSNIDMKGSELRYLYMIRNKINGKVYIGQTVDFKKRIMRHFNTNVNTFIHNAIVKYGKENFEYRLLLIREISFIDDAERCAIRYYNSIAPNGYNLESGGALHKKANKETKLKLAKAAHERIIKKETRDKISKNTSNQWKTTNLREKVINALTGRVVSEETRKKQSIKRKGRITWNSGKHFSEEIRLKISKANKGKKAWNKGKKHSEETKLKISIKAKERRSKKEISLCV